MRLEPSLFAYAVYKYQISCAGLLLCDKVCKTFQKKLSTNFKTDIANDLL